MKMRVLFNYAEAHSGIRRVMNGLQSPYGKAHEPYDETHGSYGEAHAPEAPYFPVTT